MEESRTQRLLHRIQNHIDNFESEKYLEKNENQSLGIIYTPNKIVDYIVSNIFRKYLENFINSEGKFKENSDLEGTIRSIIKNQKIKAKLDKKVKNLRILDPSCGSGRFLLSVGEQIYKLYRILEPKTSNFELKRKIIENNLFGIEIDNSAINISKLRIIKWLLSTNINGISSQNINLKNLNQTNFEDI
ncbi:MAG: N-6 DNA methylase, partial [Promethearchaeota archaeon]